MLQWSEIDTVLLDMDGTLLDLHFDNYFWQVHLPKRWAEIAGISEQAATTELMTEYQHLQGKLEWYCLDYWGKRLQLPITELKREIMHKIQMRADVPEFLTALKKTGRHVVLVTNAHPDSLSLKIERTDLANYIEQLISTHEFGVTKESQALWQRLQHRLGFDPNRTLFVDDSLPILQSAKQYGIKHLLAVANPDSQKPHTTFAEFPAITDYQVLLADIYQSRR
ncbi:haloacid dehalogenase [Alishewanella longhuensis]|uniref:Haloacid dehalogenase n=1 Tax=Alishewanella longhuensis TaxID=1091037 RepID=A0ABQ3L377_9ALTE|nr:GMP/IMP nucleotidase [Alishewanella longhuensis]GHG75358.1 haloacid dehalogenase [Alishewanella longhuensis]